jgi:hypothetical protein
MPFVTRLSDDSKTALRVILDRGVVSGADLLSLTGMAAGTLMAAIDPLLKSEVVGSSGSVYQSDDIKQAFFNLRPAARDLAEGYLNL